MEFINKYFTEQNKSEHLFSLQLKKVCNKANVEAGFILLKMKDTSQNSKLELRKIIAEHPGKLIILCTYNVKVLVFSTGLPVFHAFNLMDWNHSMKGFRYKLTLLKKADNGEGLMFYYNGGMVNLKFDNISFIKGSGNYCRIFAHEKRSFLVTMRIKEIREKIGEAEMLIDVNRSIIVNINRIAAVKKQSVIFRGTPKYVLKMGYRSVKKVRDELLWNNDEAI